MYIIHNNMYIIHNIKNSKTTFLCTQVKVNVLTLTFSTDTQFIFGYIDHVTYVTLCIFCLLLLQYVTLYTCIKIRSNVLIYFYLFIYC